MPSEDAIKPSYQQKVFPIAYQHNLLHLVASQDGRDGSLTIHQDASIYAAALDSGSRVELPLASGRRTWVQIARGSLDVNGVRLEEGDGAVIAQETALTFQSVTECEFLLFDLS